MLPPSNFIPTVRQAIPRFQPQPGRLPAPDPQQEACILHPVDSPLQIVAGPGSGKTTVLVLRALRLVLVDGLRPEQILLTTFTRKAADEIRSRLVAWGTQLIDYLRQHGPAGMQPHLAKIDINRFMTGTLDSICEDALRTQRAATDPAPVLVEAFAANALMHRRGLTNTVYNAGVIDPAAADYLANFTFEGAQPANVGELVQTVRPLFDRFAHDEIDLTQFTALPNHTAARTSLINGYRAYVKDLTDGNRLDFALLEKTFLDRLRAGRMTRFTENVRALLVDEYQDTNLQQESIYFELARQSSASLTVVGDDDQSLYRFRGATVELFRDFRQRLVHARAGSVVSRLDLVGNYRSTPAIVAFFNAFVTNDPDFQPARVNPPKPAIQAQLPPNGAPVLGMFRATADILAADLAKFLHDVFRGAGRDVNGPSGPVRIAKAADSGDYGDAVLLSHSVNEFTSPYKGQEPRQRLPHHLRTELAVLGVGVFNPRGQALRDIVDVQQLIGAMLECLDPGARLQNAMFLRIEAKQYLAKFRTAYQQYASTHPVPHGIAKFVADWGARNCHSGWPKEWPILELCFTLLTWFPRLHDDPEGQVHLEAVTRAIAQSAAFSTYKALVLHGAKGPHDERSVEAVIRDIFAPLAENLLEVDEEIMPSVPRDRFAMMTIHQAKGLEFPLVVVDVSSDYKRNHPKNRFKRFPEQPSNVTTMEEDLSGACTIGSLRQQRTSLQRTFEDLIRLYYVAYSRPQSVLLLVGLTPCLEYSTKIRHVATSWRGDGSWAWIRPYAGKKPPGMANAIPLELI